MSGPTLGRLIDRAARRHAAREWVVCGTERHAYAALAERTARLAGALRARGCAPGDRIAVLSMNCHRALELLHGLPAAGLVAVPLNFRLTGVELEYILRDSGARALFAGSDFLETVLPLAARLPELREIVVLDGAADATGARAAAASAPPASYETLLAEGGEADRAAPGIGEDDPAFIMYTSGTTGFPKGAVLSHRNVIDAAHWGVGHSAFAGIGPEDRVLVPVPLYHVAGTVTALCALLAGATAVLMRRPDIGELFSTVERERVTRMTVVPFLVQAMVESSGAERRELGSLQSVLYAGAPMPVPVLERAIERFGPRFVQAYGLTETGPSGTVLTATEHRRAIETGKREILSSVGREMLHCDVEVTDDAGRALPAGEIGEVRIRGSSVTSGYWNNQKATAESLRDGWFLTGDMGRFDAEGYLYLVDRKKDMIVSGGENVYPKEVETVLHEHPAVVDCAVLGLPDDRWGERVTAVVVTTAEVEAGDLIAHCRERLAGFKCPKDVRFVEALPRNPSGKVLKRELRETLAGRS